MKSVVIGTAGHIDHGKSALVQALTGTDPDRLKEEKARGITIDLGFAHLAIGAVSFAFVDVPGHERFVKNMLAGVGGIDLVMLVIAADESVMPQTREHFDICRLLRVPTGIVVLTKADLVDAETMELARLEVASLTAGSFLADAPVVAVSSRTGEGLDRLRAALVEMATRVRGRSAETAVRLPIDRVFSLKGFGTIVTGTLVGGRVRVDDDLSVMPGERRVKVRGVQVHGVRQLEALAGQRTALNLGGVVVDQIRRGQTLVPHDAFEQTRVVDAVLEVLPDANLIKPAARIRFHQGTAEILGRVAVIGTLPVGAAGQEGLPPGSRGYVRLKLESPVVVTRGDRFIVRAYSPPRTIGGGQILDPLPPRTAVRSDATLERCRKLDFESGSKADTVEAELRAARVVIEDAGESAFPQAGLVSRLGITPGEVPARVETLTKRGDAFQVKDLLVARTVVERLRQRIIDALAQHHRTQPLSEGLAREEARVRLFGRGHSAVFEYVLDGLLASGAIIGRDRLALSTHQVELSPDAQRARTYIDRAFREAGLTPPDLASLMSTIGTPPSVVQQAVTLLQRERVLIKIDTLLFHDAVLRQLKENVTAMKTSAGGDVRLDVSTFKERFGVTRKYAIPLLEYLDRERVTRRVGEARIIL
ncbi:MAG: selenocysteine-specific translation elongation factor [Blastocatellia bacterium]|nr:MAG: selenocysteine-specific translation elongation factor [Blastocatellia bacterium]